MIRCGELAAAWHVINGDEATCACGRWRAEQFDWSDGGWRRRAYEAS